jgi:hypothetical protein
MLPYAERGVAHLAQLRHSGACKRRAPASSCVGRRPGLCYSVRGDPLLGHLIDSAGMVIIPLRRAVL